MDHSGGALCAQGLSFVHCAAGGQPVQSAGGQGAFRCLRRLGVRTHAGRRLPHPDRSKHCCGRCGRPFWHCGKYAGFLPASFRASIVAACERSIGAVLADNAVVLADSIVENVLQPLLTPVITLVLFFLFYALLRLLVSMLVTVLGLVNKLPVIGTVNRALAGLWRCHGAAGYLFGAVHPVGHHRHHRRKPECAQRYGDEQQSLLQNLQSLQPFL